MNKKLIIGLSIGVTVLGLGAFLLFKNNDNTSGDSNRSDIGQDDELFPTADNGSFNPIKTIESVDGNDIKSTWKSDKDRLKETCGRRMYGGLTKKAKERKATWESCVISNGGNPNSMFSGFDGLDSDMECLLTDL